MSFLNKRLWPVVRCLLFLLVLAAVVLRLDSFFMLIQEDNLCPRYYRYPKNTFDVTFLGASLVLYGIYPMELYRDYGIAAYNLSTGNQSLEASYYLAKESIEKDHPSLIVLDCSRAWDDEESMEPQYIHYITDTMPYLSRNRITMIRELAKEGENRKALLLPLMAYHSRWEELTYEDALPQAKEMVYGAKVTSRLEPAVPFEEAQITEHVVSETSRKYIEKTIGLCRETGTELLLFTMPVPGKNKFFDQHGYDLRASAAREVEQIARENGVGFVNYLEQSQDLGLDLEHDAMDGEHLNRWGAEKFTKILGRYIKDNYEIPDRRGSGGAYKTLDADLEDYPVSRMRDSLRRSLFLRDYAATFVSDAGGADGQAVEDAVVLITLNGTVDPEILTEEDAQKLRSFGLTQDLHSWTGHGWLAVIDGGKVVYESSPEEHTAADSGTDGGPADSGSAQTGSAEDGSAETGAAGTEAGDFADSFEGTAGRVHYQLSSGTVDEESVEIRSGDSIFVNGMEYSTEDRGLHFAVFRKSTGELMDACWLNIHSRALSCEHDNH
jgi:hypothetical protein